MTEQLGKLLLQARDRLDGLLAPWPADGGDALLEELGAGVLEDGDEVRLEPVLELHPDGNPLGRAADQAGAAEPGSLLGEVDLEPPHRRVPLGEALLAARILGRQVHRAEIEAEPALAGAHDGRRGDDQQSNETDSKSHTTLHPMRTADAPPAIPHLRLPAPPWLMAVLVLLIALPSAAQTAPVAYNLSVELDPTTHRLTGHGTVHWTNGSANATGELRMHLYLNAFRGPNTTFMREWTANGGIGSLDPWGGIELEALTTANGFDLMPGLEMIRPDDGNPDDATLARVPLPKPLGPGQAVDLEMRFSAQLPELLARTGFAGDFHMVAQWFPKIGVLLDSGWSCHQFHASSEFFADFASWRVEVEVPKGWVVGSTGFELAELAGSRPGRRRVILRADRVHDFAWCAAPAELMEVVETGFEPERDIPPQWLAEARRRLGLSAAELELPPIHLRLLLPRSQGPLTERMLRAVRLSVAWMGLWYGPYPYPQLTVVSPPLGAEGAAGMEYPTLITTGASLFEAVPPFGLVPWVEEVSVHEFAHQYFYGLVASNESEQAWLDEGLAEYVEDSCLTAIVDDGLATGRLVGWPWASERLALAGRRLPVTIDRRPWEFRHSGDYADASYSKTALALATIEGLVGRDRFARALRAYVAQWSFRHPAGADLEAALTDASGADLGWFFTQVVGSDAVPDWAVLQVRSRRLEASAPSDGDGAPPSGDLASAVAPQPYRIEVELGRVGDLIAPVEVELDYTDGHSERRSWDGRARWVRWTFDAACDIEAVTVDPDGVWLLETRRGDNRWRRRPSSGPRFGIGTAAAWLGGLAAMLAGG